MRKTDLKMAELNHLLRLALPVSLSLFAGLLMQVVDTLFVGRLGPVAIGGVSLGGAVFSTFMVVGLGLLTGLDYLVSHAFGAKRFEECHRYLIQALYIALAASVVFTLVMFSAGGMFRAFGIEDGVARQATTYMKIVALSLAPFLLFVAVRQYLQAFGDAMAVLVILLIANIFNAFGNWILIFGHWGFPRMEVAGSAVATLLGRILMLVLIVVYVLWRDAKFNLGLRSVSLRFARGTTVELLRLGGAGAAQMLFEVGVFSTATMLAGRLGAIPLAAHQLVLQLASTSFMIPLGLSSATAVRVGQALGAGNRNLAVRIGWLSLGFGVCFAILMAGIMFLSSKTLLGVFTTDVAVIELGKKLLLVAALFQVSDGLQVIGTGALRGIGNTKTSMFANLCGHWFLGLPIGALLCFGLGWGAIGLWIGLSLGLTAVAAVLVYVWWKKTSLSARLQNAHF